MRAGRPTEEGAVAASALVCWAASGLSGAQCWWVDSTMDGMCLLEDPVACLAQGGSHCPGISPWVWGPEFPPASRLSHVFPVQTSQEMACDLQALCLPLGLHCPAGFGWRCRVFLSHPLRWA